MTDFNAVAAREYRAVTIGRGRIVHAMSVLTFCGADSRRYLSGHKVTTTAQVTCKRCLRTLAAIVESDHAAALEIEAARPKAKPAGTFNPDGTINADLADAKVAQVMRPDPVEAMLDAAFGPIDKPAKPFQVRDLVTRKGEPDGPLGRVQQVLNGMASVSFSHLPAQWHRVSSLEHARRHYARDAFVGPPACGISACGRITTGDEDRVTCPDCLERLRRLQARQRALYAAQQSCTGCNSDTCTLHGMRSDA